jgi:hypothetical protein
MSLILLQNHWPIPISWNNWWSTLTLPPVKAIFTLNRILCDTSSYLPPTTPTTRTSHIIREDCLETSCLFLEWTVRTGSVKLHTSRSSRLISVEATLIPRSSLTWSQVFFHVQLLGWVKMAETTKSVVFYSHLSGACHCYAKWKTRVERGKRRIKIRLMILHQFLSIIHVCCGRSYKAVSYIIESVILMQFW